MLMDGMQYIRLLIITSSCSSSLTDSSGMVYPQTPLPSRRNKKKTSMFMQRRNV